MGHLDSFRVIVKNGAYPIRVISLWNSVLQSVVVWLTVCSRLQNICDSVGIKLRCYHTAPSAGQNPAGSTQKHHNKEGNRVVFLSETEELQRHSVVWRGIPIKSVFCFLKKAFFNYCSGNWEHLHPCRMIWCALPLMSCFQSSCLALSFPKTCGKCLPGHPSLDSASREILT